jgi:transposase-like protein
MVKLTLTCCHCGCEYLVCNGLTRNGKQCHRCNKCGRSSRENSQPHNYTHEQRETILTTYEESSSQA